MCGIAAAAPSDRQAIKDSVSAMRRRGPDDNKVVDLHGAATLGIARLAITDIPNGAQPLVDAEIGVSAVFNGAIYNVDELLRDTGYVPSSGNDGEIIAPLYRKYGLDFPAHLDGIFSIILYDHILERIVTCIDPVGVKPLYFAKSQDKFFAASVPSAFPSALRGQIRRHPAGHASIAGSQWTRYKKNEVAPVSVANDLPHILERNVRRQIPKEVEWGCFLSGGVDSSLIATLARRISGRAVTITCGFPGSPDCVTAARLADAEGFDHHEVPVDEEELESIVEEVVVAAETFDPFILLSGVGTFIAARQAHALGLKVVLCGEGADELFGGYVEYEAADPGFLKSWLRHDQNGLGATECLRLDRCTMHFGIEARVPFLATEVRMLAAELEKSELIHTGGGVVETKVALRQAARVLLPKFVAERPKVRFYDGAGLPRSLEATAERCMKGLTARDNPLAALVPNMPYFSSWLMKIWSDKFCQEPAPWLDMITHGTVRPRYSIYLPMSPR